MDAANDWGVLGMVLVVVGPRPPELIEFTTLGGLPIETDLFTSALNLIIFIFCDVTAVALFEVVAPCEIDRDIFIPEVFEEFDFPELLGGGGRMVPLGSIRDRGIARLTST